MIFPSVAIAQKTDSLLNKAGFYYENEEYMLAIPRLTEYLHRFPDDFSAIQMRGNCYRETGQNRLAIHDYLSALKFRNDEADLIYNLGIAYDKELDTDSAIYYFQKFVNLEPERSEGYIRLSILFMYTHPEWGDSAVYYAGKAVHSDPENPMNYNFLAMAYYSSDQNKNALETALRGLAIDSSIYILNRTAGISSFFMKDYKSAINYFERAYNLNPEDFISLDYKIQTMLLQNTNPEKFSFPSGGVISLNGIFSGNIRNTEKQVLNLNGPYAYKKLINKFRSTPLKMSLDEFFMLYFGSSTQGGYAPYKKPSTEKNPENDLNNKALDLEEILFKNPADFPLYLILADTYLEFGNVEKYFENRFKYFGFTESIKAAGDGLTPAKAYIVTDVSHEYNIMVSLGYSITAQRLVKHDKKYYDVLTGQDDNNVEVLIYFNIDKPYGTLSKKGKN